MMKSAVVMAGLCAGLIVPMTTSPSSAAGCGGYVNVWISGCAPWDNNPRRMRGAPGYVAPRNTAPVIVAPQQRILVQPAAGNRFISTNGSTLISNNRSGVISDYGLGTRR
jgi:hypothetical protein